MKTIVLVLWMCLSALTFAEESESTSRNVGPLHLVDHENLILVIDDFTYGMDFSLKVFNRKNKPVNRYSLKEGQRVRFNRVFRNGRYYIDRIDILRDAL